MESDHLDREAAMLALRAALLWCQENGRASDWGDRDWSRLVGSLSPREIIVVAWKGIRGMTQDEVGAWLGVSRGRVDQHWQSALKKMREPATAMVV